MWVLETRIEQLETDLEVLKELNESVDDAVRDKVCLLYTSPSPRDS